MASAGQESTHRIPVSLIKKEFRYEPETGIVSRVGSTRKLSGGSDAYLYTKILFDGRKLKIYLHTIAWIISYGEWPAGKIHHRNDDWHDNRLANLKINDDYAHSRRKRIGKNNSSGAKGVFWDNSRSLWRAEIMVDYKHVYLGRFTDKQDALAAYIAASEKYHGEDGRSDG